MGEDAFAHQHDTCVNSAQPVDSVPVSHAPDAVCGQGDQTTTSESTPDRMLLTCASPGCQFRVHSSPKYGDFCCKSCRLGGAARHGPACERIAAPTSAVQTSAMDMEDAFAHQHDTCVNSAQPVHSAPVSHAPGAVCGQGDQTTTSESTPDRMLLTCASPGCQFRVHSSP